MFLHRLSSRIARIEDINMSETTYNVIAPEHGLPVKAWTKGVPLEDAARQQLLNAAQLPFVFKWIAAMPDVHWGIGATVPWPPGSRSVRVPVLSSPVSRPVTVSDSGSGCTAGSPHG
jgi:hypothetical protein